MADTETLDPAAGFAKLMGQAKEAAEQTRTEAAPYGYTQDEETGELRPKKAAGRPRKSPSLDELKAQRAETAAPDDGGSAAPGDRAPDEKASRRRRGTSPADAKKETASYPQFREGVIEKGVNRLYRKAGKMVRVWDQDVGQALIDITRAEDDDDITVGKAWEEIARTNPRIRKFLLKIIKGGNWGQLVMAHAPVGLALFMKFRLAEKLPLGGLVEAYLTPDEDGEAPADGGLMSGLRPSDMADMGDLMRRAEEMAHGIMAQRQENGQDPTAPPDFKEMAAYAAANGGLAPPDSAVPQAFRRQQPQRTSRAARRGK